MDLLFQGTPLHHSSVLHVHIHSDSTERGEEPFASRGERQAVPNYMSYVNATIQSSKKEIFRVALCL